MLLPAVLLVKKKAPDVGIILCTISYNGMMVLRKKTPDVGYSWYNNIIMLNLPSFDTMVLGTSRVSFCFLAFFLMLKLFLRWVFGEELTNGPT